MQEDQILREVVGTGELGKWAIIAHQFTRFTNNFHLKNQQTVPGEVKLLLFRWQNHVNPALQNNHPWSEQ
jgi:hypothetical protein